MKIPIVSRRISQFDMKCKCGTLLRISNKEDSTDYEAEYELTSAQGHTHEVSLDKDGNGQSSEAKGHSHRVVKETVLAVNGHTHKLKELEEEEEDDEDEEDDKKDKNTDKNGKAKNKGSKEKLNGGKGVESADEKAAIQDDKDDDEGIKDIPDAELIKFLVENPNPTDANFHEHSEKAGWNNQQAESVAYKFATRYAQFRTGGTSKGKRPSNIVAEQESMGMQVELEHTPNIDDAHKIVWDHLSEKKNSLYYSFLEVVEKSIEEGPESELFRGMLKLMEKMEK